MSSSSGSDTGGSSSSFGAAITTGDIVGVALDMDNSKLYFSNLVFKRHFDWMTILNFFSVFQNVLNFFFLK